jgi:hypothetical protein
MPVGPDARFAGLPVLAVTAPDGGTRRVVALRLRREPAPPDSPRHRLVQGEQVDFVARLAYGADGLWWRVLDANPVLHPFDLRPGDELVLPPPADAGRVTRARTF